MKRCPKCRTEKPRSEFYRNKSKKDGLTSWCKTCAKQASRAWKAANPEKVRDYNRKWNAANPSYKREWNAANPEKCREYSREHYAANPEKKRDYQREWAAANPDYSREWNAANVEKKKEYSREWREANPDKAAANSRNRRAREAGAEGSHTAEDVAAMFDRWPNCLCCGTDKKLTVDHVVPLDAGGSGWPDNLQTLCGGCNSSKGVKTADYRPGGAD